MKTTHTTCLRQTGLTLVEILVAMVISLILMAGVLQIFQANKQSFRVQESLSLIQENGRTAMRILTEDLRMAAYWGCRSRDINIGEYITDNLDPAGAGYMDLLANGGVTGTNGAGVDPDSITISGARSIGIPVSVNMADTTANISITDSSGLEPGDIMLITDCEAGNIFQITNAASLGPADPIEHAIGGGSPGNLTAELGRAYDTDKTMVFQTRQATYTISPDPDSGEPSLSLTEGGGAPVVLVESIEDLQILFGEQPDPTTGDMRYVPADDPALNMGQVHSLRITLVARSIATNVAVGGDGRLRRTFNTTISIRNRNP